MVRSNEVDEVLPVVPRAGVDVNNLAKLGGKLDVGITHSPFRNRANIAVASRSASSDGLSYEMGPTEILDEVLGSSEVTESPDKGPATVRAQTAALEWQQLNKPFTSELTDDEIEQGFKWLSRPNPKYLGFVPGRRDNRKYLNVLPLVSAQPESKIDCYLPVSTAQRWAMVVFVLMLALMGIGAALYLRNATLASTK